jgi:hypothetical protein
MCSFFFICNFFKRRTERVCIGFFVVVLFFESLYLLDLTGPNWRNEIKFKNQVNCKLISFVLQFIFV